MTPIEINYLAVLASAVAGMALGGIWYGPLFGKSWMSLSGLTQSQLDGEKAKGMGKRYALAFVGALVMAYVLAHALVFANGYLQTGGFSSGLMGAFWNWLGFIAPVLLGKVLWEGKSFKLWILDSGYYLVALLIMGTILSLWV